MDRLKAHHAKTLGERRYGVSGLMLERPVEGQAARLAKNIENIKKNSYYADGLATGDARAAFVKALTDHGIELDAARAVTSQVPESVLADPKLARPWVLATRIAFEVATGQTNLPEHSIVLPAKLSPDQIYATRPDRSENPISFMERVWGPYKSVVFQDDITRLGDDRLVSAVRVYCSRKNLKARDHLPPARNIRPPRLSGSADDQIAHLRERDRQRKARQRSKTSG